eukprot:272756_1
MSSSFQLEGESEDTTTDTAFIKYHATVMFDHIDEPNAINRSQGQLQSVLSINPPKIAITNGDTPAGGLLVEILDKHQSIGDKYEFVINDSTHQEYIIHNNNERYIELIDDIIPLSEYHITARRYIESKKRWSKYCTAVSIVPRPNFKLVWSKQYRGSNARLSNLSRDVYCKSQKGSCTIVADKSISSTEFRQVLFSFTMMSLAQFSYCGFLQYTHNNHNYWENMRPFWDDLVVKNTDAFCLGFCNGANSIQRWVNGTRKGASKWRKDLKLQNGYNIKTNDVLLFDINFDLMVCDVYVNEKRKQNKISTDADQHTFMNVPDHIIPVYSHEHNPYIIAHSKVAIKMESYVLRSPGPDEFETHYNANKKMRPMSMKFMKRYIDVDHVDVGKEPECSVRQCTTRPTRNVPVLTVSEPHNFHIPSAEPVIDPMQSTPTANTNVSNITEEELRHIRDSVILTDVLLEYAAFLVDQTDGMTQCSNQTDAGYNSAFTCKNGGSTNSNSSHRNSARRNNNNGNFDDNKQNDDKDDKKYALDEPRHGPKHSCNHLKECTECGNIFTRNCEHIRLLRSLLTRLQQQHEYDASRIDIWCKAIEHRRCKSKNKNKFNSIPESKTQHDLYPHCRAKKHIKISRKMTQNVIPSTINQSISNVYAFMERSIGMQSNDGQIQCDINNAYQILNCDFYDKSNKPLYCMMKRIPPTSNAGYKWQVVNDLFTAPQATQLSGGPLPRSSRVQLQRCDIMMGNKQLTFDAQFIKRIMKETKWNTISINNRKENKQRLTFSIPQEQLNPMIARSMARIKNDATRLIPIVMFDNASKTHWIEYILLVHIQRNIDIGVSLRHNANGVHITGIHLDKVMILEQHEALLSHGTDECHCLDG